MRRSGDQFLWEVTELRVSGSDMALKVLSCKHPSVPVPITAKLSGAMQPLHYAYRFCGFGIWTGPIKDRVSLFHNVGDLNRADVKAGGGGVVIRSLEPESSGHIFTGI